MDRKIVTKKYNKGQSTIEYFLLLVGVAAVVLAFLTSQHFKNINSGLSDLVVDAQEAMNAR